MRSYLAAQTRKQNHADGCGLWMARTESMTMETASISTSNAIYRMPSSIVDERAIPEFHNHGADGLTEGPQRRHPIKKTRRNDEDQNRTEDPREQLYKVIVRCQSNYQIESSVCPSVYD